MISPGTNVLLMSAAALSLADAVPGNWAALEKLGIVGVLLVALATIYRDGCRRQDKLETIIEKNSQVIAEDAETRRETTRVLADMSKAVERCHALTAGKVG